MDPALILISFLGLGSAGLYACVGWRVLATGGKIQVKELGIADVIAGVLLVNYFLLVAVVGFTAKAKPIHDSDLVSNAVMEIFIVAFPYAFLAFRGINVPALVGLGAVRPAMIIGLALAFLLAFYPLLFLTNFFAQEVLKSGTKQQELITYFSEASRKMDQRTLFYVFFTGVVLAPIAEEFVFRGYIYGILKRYIGIAAGVVLNAALFAAVHATPAVLPSLFVFAVCLTLVYEFTGSILVNICMHSLFNLCTLMFVFYHPSLQQ